MVKRRISMEVSMEDTEVEYKLDSPELLEGASGYIVLDMNETKSLLLRADKVLLNKDSKEWILRSCMVDAFSLYKYKHESTHKGQTNLDLYIKRGDEVLRMSEISFIGGQFRSIGAKWSACPELRGSYIEETYLDGETLSSIVSDKNNEYDGGVNEEVGFI